MKARYCNVPGIVTALSNLSFSNSVANVWFSLLLKKNSVSLQLLLAHCNKAWGVSMWCFEELCKLKHAGRFFIFAPMRSHAPLPWIHMNCTMEISFCKDIEIIFMGLGTSEATLILKLLPCNISEIVDYLWPKMSFQVIYYYLLILVNRSKTHRTINFPSGF